MSKLEEYAQRLKREYEAAESEDHPSYLNIWDDWVLVSGAISRINNLEAENKRLHEFIEELLSEVEPYIEAYEFLYEPGEMPFHFPNPDSWSLFKKEIAKKLGHTK